MTWTQVRNVNKYPRTNFQLISLFVMRKIKENSIADKPIKKMVFVAVHLSCCTTVYSEYLHCLLNLKSINHFVRWWAATVCTSLKKCLWQTVNESLLSLYT